MATLRLTWPHGIGVNVTDPETTRGAFTQHLSACVANKQGYQLDMPTTTILVPAELLQTALIEITE